MLDCACMYVGPTPRSASAYGLLPNCRHASIPGVESTAFRLEAVTVLIAPECFLSIPPSSGNLTPQLTAVCKKCSTLFKVLSARMSILTHSFFTSSSFVQEAGELALFAVVMREVRMDRICLRSRWRCACVRRMTLSFVLRQSVASRMERTPCTRDWAVGVYCDGRPASTASRICSMAVLMGDMSELLLGCDSIRGDRGLLLVE